MTLSRWVCAAFIASTLSWGSAFAQDPSPSTSNEPTAAEEAPGGEQAPERATPASPAASEEAPQVAAPLEAEAVPSPWSASLISSMLALAIGGFSAVLGIWVDRDPSRPVIFGGAMSVLITAAILVGAIQSYLDVVGGIEDREDLERMMGMVEEISAASGDPALAALVANQRQKRGKGRNSKNNQ